MSTGRVHRWIVENSKPCAFVGEMDAQDLTAALRRGSTIENAAKHLCRSGSVEDVRRKAGELGTRPVKAAG
jgi:hypothetical protein